MPSRERNHIKEIQAFLKPVPSISRIDLKSAFRAVLHRSTPAVLFVVLLSTIHAFGSSQSNVQTQPNILLFVADDLSWHSLGYAGDPLVKSPNIDRLGREGVIFSRAAVTTSICMVSRASMLTGRWLRQMGGARVTPETWPETWPAQLRKAGYFGGHIGKVHVQGQDASGYDFWAGRGGYAWLPGKVHSIRKDTDESLRFLTERPKDKPFFLQVAYTVPHAEDADPAQYLPMPDEQGLYTDVSVPVPPTATEDAWNSLPEFFRTQKNESRERWVKRFDTPEKYQTFTKNYYRLISGMDRSIGTILDTLKEQGIANNTIIIFIGDNGYFLGEHGLADKWYAYEESLRVPLVVYDPRKPASQRGVVCDDWVLNVDLAPTLCAWAGIKPPAGMQGRDLGPLLDGKTPSDWRTDFLYEFKWSSENIPASEGVCSKDWKYIRWLESGIEELFDLRRDSGEVRNLSQNPAFADVMIRMRARREELCAEIGGTPLAELQHMPHGTNRRKGASKGKGEK